MPRVKMTSEQAKINAQKSAAKRRANKLARLGLGSPAEPILIPTPLAAALDSGAADEPKGEIDAPKPVRKPGPDGASSTELEGWLVQAIGIVTVFGALALAGGNEDDPIFDALCMTKTEASAIAHPAARIIARSGINERFGAQLIQSNDYLALAMALGSYLFRAVPAVSNKVRSISN